MKIRLHREFGPGLKNIYNPITKDFNLEEFHKGPKARLQASNSKRLKEITLPGQTPDNGIYSIGGVKIDATVPTSFVLGWAAGMQYKPNFAGPCFYTVVDTDNSLNYFVTDWYNFVNYYQWYNLFVYEPTHFYANLVAVYE